MHETNASPIPAKPRFFPIYRAMHDVTLSLMEELLLNLSSTDPRRRREEWASTERNLDEWVVSEEPDTQEEEDEKDVFARLRMDGTSEVRGVPLFLCEEKLFAADDLPSNIKHTRSHILPKKCGIIPTKSFSWSLASFSCLLLPDVTIHTAFWCGVVHFIIMQQHHLCHQPKKNWWLRLVCGSPR